MGTLRRTSRRTAIVAGVGLLTVPAFVGDARADRDGNKMEFKANLTAGAVVPPVAPAGAAGTGKAKIKLDTLSGKACYEVETKNVAGPIKAIEVHQGAVGRVGALAIALYPGTSVQAKGKRGAGGNDGGELKGCVAVNLASAAVQSIFINPTGFYIDVRNAQFPNGAVRGQLNSPGASRVNLRVNLAGSSEVPPADKTGIGKGEVRFDLEKGTVCAKVETKNVALPYTGLDLRQGMKGAVGPVALVDFFATATSSGRAKQGKDDDKHQSHAKRCVAFDPTSPGIQAVFMNPSGYYLNVSNAAFPNGAVRGQLTDISRQTVVLRSKLTGGQVIPPVPSGDLTANGQATIQFYGKKNQVCFEVKTKKVALPVSGIDIRQGAVGANGDSVLKLFPAPLVSGKIGSTIKGCMLLDIGSELVQGIFTDPSAFYVDVTNGALPGGAIRGQLVMG